MTKELFRCHRNLVAVRQDDGSVYLSWRLRSEDGRGTAFHVEHRVPGAPWALATERPVLTSTNWVDACEAGAGRVPEGTEYRVVSETTESETAGLPNDGGQLFPNVLNDDGRRFFSRAEGTPFDTGEIVAYETNDFYTYVCGDAARAYSPEKLRHFTRQFLYFRPDVFVVFDRVTATKPEFPKTWLLHSIEEPVIDGNRFTIQHGEGRLFGSTLLPLNARFEKVGGPGKEFLVAGKNYPVEANPEAGAWRIEVTPPSQSETDCFLHVLCVADKNAPAPTKVGLLTEGMEPGQVACAVTVGERSFVAVFETEGTPRGRVLIEEAGTGSDIFAKDLATDVSE